MFEPTPETTKTPPVESHWISADRTDPSIGAVRLVSVDLTIGAMFILMLKWMVASFLAGLLVVGPIWFLVALARTP